MVESVEWALVMTCSTCDVTRTAATTPDDAAETMSGNGTGEAHRAVVTASSMMVVGPYSMVVGLYSMGVGLYSTMVVGLCSMLV